MLDGKKIKKVLITGIAGSGGSYLAEYLAAQQPHVQIEGLYRGNDTKARQNLAKVWDRVKLYACDLREYRQVLSAVQASNPDVIFHLASDADVRASFEDPQGVLNNNILGTCNLFEAVRVSGHKPVIQHCSTSEMYGQVDPKYVPIREDCPIQPTNPYAVSKAAQDFLAWTYFRSYGMPIIRTRMFAYINPRRTNLFASAFARQVARIEAGLQKELLHGNLDSVRTLIDVRDAMEAYWVAVLRCEPGEVYHIGGVKPVSVREFLNLLIQKAKVPIPLRQDPALLRPADVTLQIPDTTKFTKASGWKPKISFEDSLEHLLEAWRGRVEQECGGQARKR